ncbi:Undecaprenyl-phosphate mannosyltransferase [subsurface metagenome]
MAEKKVAIVIPAYNCEATISSVIDRIPEESWNYINQVIPVNDGSTDSTGKVLDEIAKKNPKVKPVHHEANRGYAGAQKTGFKIALAAGAEVVGLLHSDGQLAPEMLPQLLAPLFEEKADLVQGYRIEGMKTLKAGMPIYKYLANRILTTMENLAFGMRAKEFHCGYQLYSAHTLEVIPYEKLSESFHFDGEMILMAKVKKLKRADIFAPCAYRDEKSHVQLYRYGCDVLGTIIRYWRGYYHRL